MPETPLPHNVSQADLFAEKQKAAKKDSIMKRLYPGTEGTTTIHSFKKQASYRRRFTK